MNDNVRIKECSMRSFSVKGRHYLYEPSSSSILQLRKSLGISSPQIYPSINRAVVRNHHAPYLNGVSKGVYSKANNSIKLDLITSITFLLTIKCNLSCTYCYEHGVSSDFQCDLNALEMLNTVRAIRTNRSHGNHLHINFFGGEPLLKFNEIEKFILLLEEGEEFSNGNLVFTYSMTTNATLITPYMASFLSQKKFGITVSIDGPQFYHDKYRVNAQGEGSYAGVLDGIRHLKNNNCEYSLRSTYIPDGPSHLEICKHFLINELGDFHIHEAFDCISLDNLETYRKSLRGMLSYFFELARRGKKDELRRFITVVNWMKRINTPQRFTHCAAGSRSIAIDGSGNMYLCHRFAALRKNRMGYLLDQNVIHCISDMDKNMDKCSDCWVFGLCGGGCDFSRTESKGADEIFCSVYKTMIEELIKLYIQLAQSDLLLMALS